METTRRSYYLSLASLIEDGRAVNQHHAITIGLQTSLLACLYSSVARVELIPEKLTQEQLEENCHNDPIMQILLRDAAEAVAL